MWCGDIAIKARNYLKIWMHFLVVVVCYMLNDYRRTIVQMTVCAHIGTALFRPKNWLTRQMWWLFLVWCQQTSTFSLNCNDFRWCGSLVVVILCATVLNSMHKSFAQWKCAILFHENLIMCDISFEHFIYDMPLHLDWNDDKDSWFAIW